MNSIYDIVASINTSIADLFESCKLAGAEINGVAETVKRETETFPEINERYVGVDDVFPARVYHKISSFSTGVKPGTGTGRSVGFIVNTYSMGIVVFLDGPKSGLYPDELIMRIQASFPDVVRFTGFEAVNIRFSGAVLDSRIVYATEYANMDTYRLKAEQYLFRINYNVEMVFDKDCFKKCP